jgi:tetratricopeptide (TPR) repeat protein
MKRPHSRHYHPSQEEIASFIEGSSGEFESGRIRDHIASCARCLEAYRYAVRYRGMHEDVPATVTPSDRALRAAKSIAEVEHLHTGDDRREKRRWIPGLGPAGRIAMSAAVVAVFAAALIWLRPVPRAEGFDPRAGEIVPVTEAMEVASERNPWVLPGIEGDLSEPVVLRSGPVTITRELDYALSKLAVAYNDGSLASDEAQWLIGGYIATGQIENARVYLADAIERYPSDLDLIVLEGVLAYCADDLSKAAESFAFVLGEEEHHIVAAFNLAMVEKETGNAAKARECFERVRRLGPDRPLAKRAEVALESMR